MLKALVRNAMRDAVSRARRLARDLDPPSGNFSNPQFAYASINAALTRPMREAPGVLRPSYTWGVLQAVHLARSLAVPRISVVEFGVASEPHRKLSPIFGLKYFLAPGFAGQQWSEMFDLAHVFDHPLYGRSDGLVRSAERPLAARRA